MSATPVSCLSRMLSVVSGKTFQIRLMNFKLNKKVKMNRRSFLKKLSYSFLAIPLLECSHSKKSNPNIVMIFADGALELYDLEKDLSESDDLATKLPGVASELHQQLILWRKQVGAQLPQPNPDFDPKRALENDHANSLELLHLGHD
jgi:hypothetical protein